MIFENLKGLTLTSVVKGNDEIIFTASSGKKYKQHHSQDCCESVEIKDIVGDLADLVGSPILQAEVASNENISGEDWNGWTFYKLATIKGSVTISWLADTDSYYSVSVDFKEITNDV